MEVEIISNEKIKPSSPTDHHLKTFKLSSLDTEYIPLILFYTPDVAGANVDSISDRLKKSLSDTLTRFYPIAGRIRDHNNNNSWVECTDEGVEYIQTRINGKVSDFTMTTELLHQLVPVHTSLPTEVPAVIQVNFFSCGGVAITVCISHKIGDMSTYATFINSWAATARGAPPDEIPCPSFDSKYLFSFPVPDTSDTENDARWYSSSDEEEDENLVTKRLVFDGEKVTALRERIGGTLTYPTRVEAVSALIWKSSMEASLPTSPKAAKDTEPGHVSEMYIIVNARKKMDPPLTDTSFGNIFCMAAAKASITSGGVDLNDLVGHIHVAIDQIDGDHVKRMQNGDYFDSDSDDEEYDHHHHGDEDDNDYGLMSWCNFPLYEIDFGFGKPNLVTTDAAEVLDKNNIYLMDTKIGKGVVAWIKLKREKMVMFLNNKELLEFATIFD